MIKTEFLLSNLYMKIYLKLYKQLFKHHDILKLIIFKSLKIIDTLYYFVKLFILLVY